MRNNKPFPEIRSDWLGHRAIIRSINGSETMASGYCRGKIQAIKKLESVFGKGVKIRFVDERKTTKRRAM